MDFAKPLADWERRHQPKPHPDHFAERLNKCRGSLSTIFGKCVQQLLQCERQDLNLHVFRHQILSAVFAHCDYSGVGLLKRCKFFRRGEMGQKSVDNALYLD